MGLLFTSILKWNLTFLFFNASLFRNTLSSVFVLELVMAVASMLKSGNTSEKI